MTLTYDDIADRVNDHQVAFDELAAADKAKHRHRVQPFRTRGFAAIGLHNPKTPENVGGVIRAAHAYGAASVAISGDRINGRPITHPTNTTRADKHIPIYRGDLRDLIPFGAVPVAIELVDDRSADYSNLDVRSLVADNSWSAGIVLTEFLTKWPDLEGTLGRATQNGSPCGEGFGRDILGHPFNSAAWLATQLNSRGVSIKAGQIVMTGSVMKTVFPEAPAAFRFDLAGVGIVEVQVR